MNYGFEEIVYELPKTSVDIKSLVQEAGFDEKMYERLKNGGLKKIPVSEEKNIGLLVNRAISKLIQKTPATTKHVKGIIFAHSIPSFCPQNVSFFGICLEQHGLNDIPRIAISGQPCSILHFAVQTAEYWLRGLPKDEGILLIAGDQAYSADERVFFGSGMGDVAIAGLIKRNTPRNRILACVSNTRIICVQGEASPDEDLALFRQLAPQLTRQTIMECLNKADVTLQDLSYIVPHTPYNAMWDPIAKILRFPREKILTEYMEQTGHLNSNDSYVHYIRAVNEGKIKEGDLALLVNPGFGGTRGSTLIMR